ncbi:23S rRNA (uracil(1939)-C(5))-methyltransferase RlmD [Mechercharimyces sp. CAU 1602]|uniref:23S rRNA (uracil(1939)-C(5))-methyltransferase RlmD n=1 Tax=Mechercharimyces sp. CAU 1602 TaxID=2973933 RepID=UPI0021622507|nr:23S rRNA (uracil(1939)-C(5))-methyltransferase RlmD [Mechercharimyces sp. CAU 1602]MCS1350033.1 23S rRNA (uracil(1939)-C(5))-methyltransferase RlmD [Mechercharimyces sp. CAU 1602]
MQRDCVQCEHKKGKKKAHFHIGGHMVEKKGFYIMAHEGTHIQLKPQQVIRLPIKRMGINGEGVGFYQRQVVFVEGAIPGEHVLARVQEVKRQFVRASLLKIIKRSPARINPPCPVYDECGGCQLQHMSYEKQLVEKRELVKEAFSRYTRIRNLPLEETVGMNAPWAYRNKAQLPLQKVGDRVAMGMYSAQSHRLVEIGDCGVQHEQVNKVLELARRELESLGVPIYHEKKHKGAIRHLVARVGFTTGELQVVVVSRTSDFPQQQAFISRLITQFPAITSVVLNVNPIKTSRIFGTESRVLWGKEKIEEKLGDLTFRLSALSFFQLNPQQTVQLYRQVERVANLQGAETVIDAYCGAGTIGLWLAASAERVIGMDTTKEAIVDANENAQHNGITNVEYHVGAAEKLIPKWMKAGLQPDVIVVDPPRTGLGEPLRTALVQSPIPRLIYVSCNPSTLAKDCAELVRAGYRVKQVIPVDLFPQTAHVEAVCLLEAGR